MVLLHLGINQLAQLQQVPGTCVGHQHTAVRCEHSFEGRPMGEAEQTKNDVDTGGGEGWLAIAGN